MLSKAQLAFLAPLVALANAAADLGTIAPRDSTLTYSGYDSTTLFCAEFWPTCVNYVGGLGYHHAVDCVLSQKGPSIQAFCGGIKKAADGTWGTGPITDFTTLVCPQVEGCEISASPADPTDQYSGAQPAATTSSVPATVASAISTTTGLTSLAIAKGTTASGMMTLSILSAPTSTASAVATTSSIASVAQAASVQTTTSSTSTTTPSALAQSTAASTTSSASSTPSKAAGVSYTASMRSTSLLFAALVAIVL